MSSDNIKKITLLAFYICIASILHAQISKTVNVTAGGLSTSLTMVEKGTITNLTVTGTIDARDFKAMRDGMYSLTTVDLKGVTILAYTGNEGTEGSPGMSYTYPANTLPAFSFFNGRGKFITSITLPDNITAIDRCAIWECNNLKSINIPLLTTKIGIQAFDGCSSLANIALPSNLTEIGSNAFRRCNSLPTISIPSKVTTIGEGAFSNDALINVASDNPNYTSSDGVLFTKNKTQLLQCPTSKTGQYIIPSSVNIIGKSAFYLCKLSSVIIPSSVTEILEAAFYQSSLLLSIDIPSSVTTIGTGVFNSCIKLNSVTIPSSVKSIEHLAFYKCISLTSVYIPSSVTSIHYSAFAASVTNINVDENNPNYSSIDGVLFDKNKNRLIQYPVSKMGSYSIPSTVYSIEGYAFNECNGLTSIIIPSSVTTIGEYSFWGCSGLQSISIPASVTSITGCAFYGCSGLTSFYAHSIIPIDLRAFWCVFNDVNKTTCTLYVPFGTAGLYAASDKWKEFINIIEMPGLFLSTNTLSLGANVSTASINLASSVNWTAISDQDWLTLSPKSGMSGISAITLNGTANPNSVTRTANVTITATGQPSQTIRVTQYGKVEVTAGNLKNLFGDQLATTTNLTLTGTIDARDFRTMRDEMPLLTDVDLIGVTIVAYSGTEGTNPTGWGSQIYAANTIPTNAYFNSISGQGKASLRSFIFPPNVISIESFAFGGCIGLTSIVIPSSVASMGGFAFINCNTLSSIYEYSVSPIDLSNSSPVFANFNKNTCTLYVPSGSKSNYQTAVQWKDFTNIVEIPGFILSSTSARLATEEGSKAIVDIYSYVTWTAISDQSWLTVSPATGTNYNKLLFTAEANPTAAIRTATVIVSATGVASQTISITQERNSEISSEIQQIALSTGWNIISANVVAVSLDLKTIFQPLIDNGTLKKVMDETGKTIEDFGDFGGWKNTIGNLNMTKGYKVKVTAASTLSLQGVPVQLPLDINLNIGWNIISYPATSAQEALAIFQPLITAGKLKKVMDESGKTIEDFGDFGGWKSTIGNLIPGKGYKVKVNENCTMTISASGVKSAVIVTEVLASEHFSPVFEGNGTDHMNIHLLNLQGSGLQAGDQIGVFDGENCVGSATIALEQLMEGSISIAASAIDEPSETINGFIPGHPVQIYLYRNGQAYPLEIEKMSGNASFEKNGSLFATVNAGEVSNLSPDSDNVSFICYPNPFTDEIAVEILNFKQEKITVEIYNMAGQKIKSLYKGKNSKSMVLRWNATNDANQRVTPGIYLCKDNGLSRQVILEGRK